MSEDEFEPYLKASEIATSMSCPRVVYLIGVNNVSKQEVEGLHPPSFLSRFLTVLSRLRPDETDTKNKSYVCFRRREIKLSLTPHITLSDKLHHL